MSDPVVPDVLREYRFEVAAVVCISVQAPSPEAAARKLREWASRNSNGSYGDAVFEHDIPPEAQISPRFYADDLPRVSVTEIVDEFDVGDFST